jgi:hypothetical protein
MILRDALAFGIHQRQIVLSTGVTLFGSHAIPLQRVGVAVSNTATFIVHAPQSVLRLSVALIGKLEQEGQCRRVVALVIRRNGVLQRSSQHGCCKAQRQQEQGGSVTKHGLHGSGHRFIQTFAARRRRQLGWECVAGRFLWVQLQLRPAGYVVKLCFTVTLWRPCSQLSGQGATAEIGCFTSAIGTFSDLT